MSAERVSIDDLAFAAEWLDAYDDEHEGGDGTGSAAGRRVAAWLRAEVNRRHEDAAVRRIAAETGAPPARCREVLRETLAARSAGD